MDQDVWVPPDGRGEVGVLTQRQAVVAPPLLLDAPRGEVLRLRLVCRALVEQSQEYSLEQLLEESSLAQLSEEYSPGLPRAELPGESSPVWLSGL